MRYVRSFIFCAVLIVAVMATLPNEAYAQESVRSDGAVKNPSAIEKMGIQVGEMHKSIKEAINVLEKLNKKSPDDRLKGLESFLKAAQDAADELDEGGSLFSLVKSTLKATEDMKKEYEKKSTDSNISAQTRYKYGNKARDLDKKISRLYDIKLLIAEQRDKMLASIKKWSDEKSFISDMIRYDELGDAAKALEKVFENVKGLNQTMENFEKIIIVEEKPEETEPSRN